MNNLEQSSRELVALYVQIKSAPVMDLLNDEIIREQLNNAMLKVAGALLKIEINRP